MVGVVCVGVGAGGGVVGVETTGVDGSGMVGVETAGVDGGGLLGSGELGGVAGAGCSTIASVTINSAFAGRIGNNSQVLEMVMVAFPAKGNKTINSFLESIPSCIQSDWETN